MGGGQTKVYTPGSGDDESLPSKDANETPLIRLVNLAHYLDHHVPADNVKCREALAEIMAKFEKIPFSDKVKDYPSIELSPYAIIPAGVNRVNAVIKDPCCRFTYT